MLKQALVIFFLAVIFYSDGQNSGSSSSSPSSSTETVTSSSTSFGPCIAPDWRTFPPSVNETDPPEQTIIERAKSVTNNGFTNITLNNTPGNGFEENFEFFIDARINDTTGEVYLLLMESLTNYTDCVGTPHSHITVYAQFLNTSFL